MVHASNAIAGLVVFGDLGPESDDGACEVAANCGACWGEEGVVDMFPEILSAILTSMVMRSLTNLLGLSQRLALSRG